MLILKKDKEDDLGDFRAVRISLAPENNRKADI